MEGRAPASPLPQIGGRSLGLAKLRSPPVPATCSPFRSKRRHGYVTFVAGHSITKNLKLRSERHVATVEHMPPLHGLASYQFGAINISRLRRFRTAMRRRIVFIVESSVLTEPDRQMIKKSENK
jgi:hypothetical protein